MSERGVSVVEETSAAKTPRSETRCPDHKRGLAFYRQQHRGWLRKRGATSTPSGRSPRSCPDARYLAVIWRKRASLARYEYGRWYQQQIELRQNPTWAICHVFGEYCSQALRVASCESGRNTWAQNGQYLGMFQMGDYARSTYGHSSTPLGQAKAAYRYFMAAGADWSPWSCKPW